MHFASEKHSFSYISVIAAALAMVLCFALIRIPAHAAEEPTETAAVPAETETVPETTAPKEKRSWNPFRDDQKIINIMIIGQAAREGESSKLSDTNILCTINTETKVVTLTSILRDTYVRLPSRFVDAKGRVHDGGHTRINSAYALGNSWGGTSDAMKYMSETIMVNFGVEVDHTVEIDFDAFENVVDLLGGIKLDLTADEAKYLTKYFKSAGFDKEFKEGTNQMNGWESLVYARMRKANYGDNDFHRTNRQRTVMKKLLEKCKRRSVFQLIKVAKEVLPYIDTDMDAKDTLKLALQLIPMLSDLQMESRQCPAPGTYWGEIVAIGGYEAGVLNFDAYQNRKIMMEYAEADHMDE